ncbi:MAG: thermonuclease family protein [Cloacibacterium sp.]|nr:thermonuclease family protein [Cloacibacterium sp.]
MYRFLFFFLFFHVFSAQTTFYKVKKIADGDTFWIDNGTHKGEKIRLIGIDAPESRNFGIKIKQEYFGKEAKNYLKNLLKNKKVRLELDIQKTDRYGRTLAYVYLENGIFLNAHLVENGYALAYTIAPNVKFAPLFYQLQIKARRHKKGIWK